MQQFEIHPAFIQLSESYRTVDWPALLLSAEKSLDIVVYYWSQWTKEHFKMLTSFLQKGGQIRFYMTDISNPNLAQQVKNIFPQNSENELIEKIKNTYEPLQHFLQQSQLPIDQVKVFFVDRLLPYSLQCIDNKIVVLSLFAFTHDKNSHSPAFILDLVKSADLKKFFLKELNALIAVQQATQ